MSNTIENKIDKWHDSDSELPLHEYLGLTKDEYIKWLCGDWCSLCLYNDEEYIDEPPTEDYCIKCLKNYKNNLLI